VGALPHGAGRAMLEQLAEGAVAKWHAACDEAARLAAVLTSLEGEAPVEAAASDDPEVQRQLAQLHRVERDTREQVEGLRRRVERLHAVASTQEALLRRLALQVGTSPHTPVALQAVHEQLTALEA